MAGVAVDRRVLLQWINAVQEVFLKLLAAGRHAVGMPLDGVSPQLMDHMHTLDEAIAQYLEALADRLDGRQDHAVPAASKLLSDAAKALQAQARDASPDATTLAHLKDYGVLSRELLDALGQLEQDLQVAAEVVGGQDRGNRGRPPGWGREIPSPLRGEGPGEKRVSASLARAKALVCRSEGQRRSGGEQVGPALDLCHPGAGKVALGREQLENGTEAGLIPFEYGIIGVPRGSVTSASAYSCWRSAALTSA